jgi:hypothetical protein
MFADTDLFRLFTGTKQPPAFLKEYDEAVGKWKLNRQKIDWIKDLLKTAVHDRELKDCVLIFLFLNELITRQERLPHGVIKERVAGLYLLESNKDVLERLPDVLFSLHGYDSKRRTLPIYIDQHKNPDFYDQYDFSLSFLGRQQAEKLIQLIKEPPFPLDESDNLLSFEPPIHYSANAGKGNRQTINTEVVGTEETIEPANKPADSHVSSFGKEAIDDLTRAIRNGLIQHDVITGYEKTKELRCLLHNEAGLGATEIARFENNHRPETEKLSDKDEKHEADNIRKQIKPQNRKKKKT